MRHKMSLKTTASACLSLLALGTAASARAQGDQSVYADALTANWQNWSWCATDFNSHDYIHAGAASVKVTYTGGWQALYLHCNTTDTTGYASLTFWINGGATNGRTLGIAGIVNGTAGANVPLNQFIAGGSVAANTWRQVTVPLSAIGLSKNSAMTGFWIAETGGNAQPAFYIDDVTLAGVNQTTSTTIKVDASANRHTINPLIYGTQGASAQMLSDLNFPLSRYGGNTATTYNWLQNASNHASDWYFESIPEASANAGDMVDNFISSALSARAQAMVTIPTLGWVAKLGANRSKLSSFSAKKYGSQQSYDGWMTDAGNGVKSNGQNVSGNDTNDANVAADSTFQQNWIKYLTGKFGMANKGGVAYYLLDNEPGIWHSTHRDIHPVGATMDEIKNKTVDYAAKIKAVDPNAQVVGPEEWGWSGYFYSGYDQQYGAAHGWNNLPDRAAHGNMDMMPWLLSSLKAYDTANKTKSLDVFSLHYYPQGGEFSSDTSTATQLLRNRSTRSLWDPNYTDASWINSQVQLIPRMKNWVSGNYAGLKTAITEYNWGADAHINGATTQADILGIFGREGLDIGTRWGAPDPATPTYKAMKMFRNVDGNNSGFGDVSVSDVAPDPDNVSSFASVRGSDGALTILLINKALSGTAQTTVSLANFTPAATAKAWQLTSANAINALADIAVSKPANATPYLTLNLPAQSVTFVAVPTTTVTATPSTPVYRLNVGAGASGTFAGDQFYATPGLTYTMPNSVSTTGVANPAPMACYQSSRFNQTGPLAYAIPNLTPGGSYLIRLHFAEPWWTAAGQRVMSITINGSVAQGSFDLVAEAGGRFKAVVKEFTAKADSSGKIAVSLGRVQGDPTLNAIEILR